MAAQQDTNQWLIIKNNDILLLTQDHSLPKDADIASVKDNFLRHFQLGKHEHIDYHCAEVDANLPIADHLYSLSLRRVIALFGLEKYNLFVKAFAVINWDKNHQHCGRCGSLTQHRASMYERVCPVCMLSFFPRISPSIIVLIRKGDHLLMARGPNFPPGIYGLIAGFVETGENLEDTIHREVKEEVGITVKNLSYFGSQAWPFPDSLIIAFMADYASGEISVDHDEIEHADWYRYDKLPGLPAVRISIASTMIDHFVASCSS